jgi:regulatory protein
MRTRRQPAPPLDETKLRALALHYVGRFATTQSKLGLYLRRKIKERGWHSENDPDIAGLIEEFAERTYVNDHAYAEGKTAALKRKGMGAYRIKSALQAAGIEKNLIGALTELDQEEARALALDFARRKRIGPFAFNDSDEKLQKRWMGAFLRAGHSSTDARHILSMRRSEVTDEQTL